MFIFNYWKIRWINYTMGRGSGGDTEALPCITVGNLTGGRGGSLERCAWQNVYSSVMNIQDFQKRILFFQACFLGTLQCLLSPDCLLWSGRHRCCIATDDVFVFSTFTVNLFVTRKCEFSGTNRLQCLLLMCPVFSVWPNLANFTATMMRGGF
jgi:hypothetical protein